jgi:hypothetical protein
MPKSLACPPRLSGLPSRPSRPRVILGRSLVLAIFLGIAPAGCDVDSVAPPQEVAWSAEVLPLPSEDPENTVNFSANVAMVAREGETSISIGLKDAEPGTTFGWTVRTGTCSQAGFSLDTDPGAFPDLVANALGTAESDIVLAGRVPDNESYAAEILGDPAAGLLILGCSEMVKVS